MIHEEKTLQTLNCSKCTLQKKYHADSWVDPTHLPTEVPWPSMARLMISDGQHFRVADQRIWVCERIWWISNKHNQTLALSSIRNLDFSNAWFEAERCRNLCRVNLWTAPHPGRPGHNLQRTGQYQIKTKLHMGGFHYFGHPKWWV